MQQVTSSVLAPTTIHKHIQVARSLFRAMLRRKLISENPFEGVKAAAAGIKDRQQFVTRAEIAHVLDACPDHHWQTIVALSRFGGLRTPSETLSVRWQDVDWETDRIIVQSPMTEHHAGKASRTIPLFAELRPYLMTTDEHFAAAVKGETKAAQNAAQHAHVSGSSGPQGDSTAQQKTPVLPGSASGCDDMQTTQMAGTGFEPATSRL